MMTSTPPACSAAAVLAMGATSPIGHSVGAMQAAMEGGLRNFQEGSLIVANGEPVRTSRLPEIDETVPRADRVALLTRQAVADLLQNATVHIPSRLPAYVGLAHDASDSDLIAIRRGMADGSGGAINPEKSVLLGYSDGRIAFLSAIAKAIRAFDEGHDGVALIIAADTRCTRDATDALARERRLLTGGDDGTIPGEAAVVALVAPPRSAAATEHGRFLVAAPEFGVDAFERIRQSPQATEGLGRAFRALREHPVVGAVRPTTVIAFETGELFFTRTFVTAYLRNPELMPEPLQHELIATNVGDTGAPAAGLAILRADGMMNHAEQRDVRRILVYGHADDGRCAAAVVMKE